MPSTWFRDCPAHEWRWIPTWADVGFDECERCGATRNYGPRPRLSAHELDLLVNPPLALPYAMTAGDVAVLPGHGVPARFRDQLSTPDAANGHAPAWKPRARMNPHSGDGVGSSSEGLGAPGSRWTDAAGVERAPAALSSRQPHRPSVAEARERAAAVLAELARGTKPPAVAALFRISPARVYQIKRAAQEATA